MYYLKLPRNAKIKHRLVMLSISFRGERHTRFMKLPHVIEKKTVVPIIEMDILSMWLRDLGVREGETFSLS